MLLRAYAMAVRKTRSFLLELGLLGTMVRRNGRITKLVERSRVAVIGKKKIRGDSIVIG